MDYEELEMSAQHRKELSSLKGIQSVHLVRGNAQKNEMINTLNGSQRPSNGNQNSNAGNSSNIRLIGERPPSGTGGIVTRPSASQMDDSDDGEVPDIEQEGKTRAKLD